LHHHALQGGVTHIFRTLPSPLCLWVDAIRGVP
jgi:hypothetical protein